ADTFQALLYRAGLSNSYSADPTQNLDVNTPHLSPYDIVRLDAGHLLRMTGWLGLIAVACLCTTLVERLRQLPFPSSFFAVLCGLLFMPLFWFSVFAKHVAIHEFEIILLAPAVLLASGWGAVRLMRLLESEPVATPRLRFWALVIIGPIVLLIPL